MINVNDKLIKNDLAKIGAEGFTVLMAIAIHINAKKTAFPKVPRLMALTGLSRNKVYKAVNTLIDAGYLERSQEQTFQEGERPKWGKVTYRVTTKYLGVYIPADTVEMEADEDEENALPQNENAFTQNGDTQNALPQNAYAQNGETLSINNKGSINKELSINKEGREPANDFLNSTSEPPVESLPKEELRILEAIDNACAYLKKYPGMIETLRLQAKDPDLSKAVIFEELKKWVRHHGDKVTFLASIGRNIPKSFVPWMGRYQQFKPNNAGAGPKTKGQGYTPDTYYTPPTIKREYNPRIDAMFQEMAKKSVA